ncbi:MAG: oxygen-insensitive NAD(P)H nitroreductase [Gammaproteobacteria bacterium]|nr:MAG: oxygen-insensitive NAD(P)H nitroreductase [Gammaproteobacteria bacterium]
MNIIDIARNRYSTKSYNPSKKILAEDFAKIKELIRLSPSSLNLQPWQFIVADNKKGKQRVLKGFSAEYAFNAEKIKAASHVVIYCSKISIDDEHVCKIANAEERDGRFNLAGDKSLREGHIKRFVEYHRNVLKDESEWNTKQLYLNIGMVLLGAAAMGIDATAMEGVDFETLNQEFDLAKQGYQAVVVMAFGYRADDDFNAKLAKSRLPAEQIFVNL